MTATISVLVNARTTSSRLPRKLVIPFAGTTLVDIVLDKLDKMDFVAHRYFAAAEDELINRLNKYNNIELLLRKPEAILPGYNDHNVQYEHYKRIESDYILWVNACHPLLSIETLKRVVEHVKQTKYNSYTSVIQTTDWIYTSDGLPVTNKDPNMASSGHSQKFYKVAHAFHLFNKCYLLNNNYQFWTLTKDDPNLIEIPESESYDVNTQMEFDVAEAAYKNYMKLN